MASIPATVTTRIRVNFTGGLLARVARMQMLLLGMPDRYNFRVITT
jgi:hypothetical protein